MKIERLEIKGFGKLNNITADFSQGINVVYGHNESGKTSMQAFVKAMLYGLKSGRAAKDGSPSPLKRFKPWTGSDYNGFLEYRLDNGAFYRIGRNFNNNTVTIHDGSFNDITAAFDSSRDRGPLFAEKHLGMNEACFERTVFIRQMEARVDGDGARELQSKLLNVCQTGFEDVSLVKAQEAIREALRNYVGTGKTTTRPLDRVLSRLNALRCEREKLLERTFSAVKIENVIDVETRKKASLEHKKGVLLKLAELLESRKQLTELKGKQQQALEILEAARTAERELAALQRKTSEYKEMKKRLSRFSVYTSEDADRLSEDYYTLQSLKKAFSMLSNEISFKKHEENVKGSDIEDLNEKIIEAEFKDKLSTYALILSILFFAAFTAGALMNLFKSFMAFPAFIPAAIAFTLKLAASRKLAELKSLKTVSSAFIKSIDEEADKKNKELKAVAEQMSALEKAVNSKLCAAGIIEEGQDEIREEYIRDFKLGVRSYYGLEPGENYVCKRVEDLNREIEALFSKAASLFRVECSSSAQIEEAISDIGQNIGELQKEIMEQLEMVEALCVGSAVSINGRENLKDSFLNMEFSELAGIISSAYNACCEDLTSCALSLKEQETLLKSMDIDENNIQRINEEIDELEARKKELEDTSTALRKALDIMTEASLELQRDFTPALNSGMSRIISLITGERYSDLRADDKLNLRILSPESGEVVPAAALSGGTVDQVYLALRLASSDIISANGETLPVIMDEVFAQYDDFRAAEALRLFKELSQKRQIILFTCKSREADLCREIFGDSMNLIDLRGLC
ncbi:MAG: AAA family ATPase [Clostridia bacterium]|nr:AAA family ATPase [Clostridia bacterium]